MYLNDELFGGLSRIPLSSRFLIGLCTLSLVCCGCQQQKRQSTHEQQPRPVQVLRLIWEKPVSTTRYTGSISAWKVEDIGFEVGGRIEEMLEAGTNVTGPAPNGRPTETPQQIEQELRDELQPNPPEQVPGNEGLQPALATVIARLNDGRYQANLRSAQARVRTSRAQREAISQELAEVLPVKIKSAELDLEIKLAGFERQRDLFNQGASTRDEYDRAQSDRETAQGLLDELKATLTVKQAELVSQEALIDEALEAVKSAERDLRDTTLLAPYSGQISKTYQTLGSVVQAGEPVVQLQMMNPIQVNVEVDSATDARYNFGDLVNAYPFDNDSPPARALVYESATVADPSTRTFLMQLLILNERMMVGMPKEFDPEKDVRTREIMALFQEQNRPGKPLFLNEKCLHRDAQGDFAFRLKDLTVEQRIGTRQSRFEVEKVYLELGEGQLNIFNIAIFRELINIESLNAEQDLFVGELQAMSREAISPEQGVERLEKRGYIHWVRERWRLRPGDFIDVELGDLPLVAGFYVPINVVVRSSGSAQSHVYVVDDPAGRSTVRRVPVEVTTSLQQDQMVRITPLNPEELSEGSLLVSSGAHYMVEGEAVRVTNLQEVSE